MKNFYTFIVIFYCREHDPYKRELALAFKIIKKATAQKSVAFSLLVGMGELVLFPFKNHTAAANKSKSVTTHLGTHQKNTIDLYGFFNKLFHHNPQVRGSNP